MDKRDAILESALKLITEKGIHNAPISKISKEAGIAAGTVYIYFNSKQEIVDELYRKIKMQLHEQMMLGIKEGESFEDKMYFIWRRAIKYFLNNSMEAKFLNQFDYITYISEDVLKEIHEPYNVFSDLIDKAIAKGILKPVSKELITAVLMGPIKELQYLYETRQIDVTEEIIEQLYNIYAYGILNK